MEIFRPDLRQRPDVGPVGERSIILGDAIHIRRADHAVEIGKTAVVAGFNRPDPLTGPSHGDGPERSGVVVGDVADGGISENERDLPSVRRAQT